MVFHTIPNTFFLELHIQVGLSDWYPNKEHGTDLSMKCCAFNYHSMGWRKKNEDGNYVDVIEDQRITYEEEYQVLRNRRIIYGKDNGMYVQGL